MRLAWFPVVPAVVACVAAAALVPQMLRHRPAPVVPAFYGSTSIYAVPLAGGPVRQVLRLQGQWGFPLATRDGKALLIERPTLTRTTVWRVPLDGGTKSRVGQKVRYTGQYAAAGPYRAAEQETRPASTGWRLDLHVTRGGRAVWSRRMPFPMGFASASADGSTVAMARMHLLELWTRHAHRVLARDASQSDPPLWTRHGRSLIYHDANGIALLDVSTAAKRTIARGRYAEPALSADGKTVYLLGLNDAVSIPK